MIVLTSGVFGGLDLFGKEIGKTWTQLALTADAGSNKIVLSEEVEWAAGDDIVIGPTSFDPWQTESFKITSIDLDNVTLTLNDTLRYKHIGNMQENYHFIRAKPKSVSCFPV